MTQVPQQLLATLKAYNLTFEEIELRKGPKNAKYGMSFQVWSTGYGRFFKNVECIAQYEYITNPKPNKVARLGKSGRLEPINRRHAMLELYWILKEIMDTYEANYWAEKNMI